MRNITIKTTLILAFMFACAAQVFAQGQEIKVDEPRHRQINTPETPYDASMAKANYSNWKRPIEAASSSGGSFQRYVSFLFPDSSVTWVPSEGDPYNYGWHSVGAVFDPTDVAFELDDDGTRLSRFDQYVVDSIYFQYLYVRYVDSVDLGAGNVKVVDTLIFQFFTKDQFRYGSFATPAEIYAKPNNFTPSLLASDVSTYEVKIPLTDADSTAIPSQTGWLSTGMILEVPDIAVSDNPNLDGSNVCGFSVAFKTMVPYQMGDTMEARDGSTPSKRLNYFGHSLYLNEGEEVMQTEHYNNSFWVPNEIRYGGEVNGWTNSIPGNAYFTDRYIYYQIHISTEDLDAIDEVGKFTMGVHPNPVNRNENLYMDLFLENAANLDIAIYDLMGNKVIDVANGYFASGEQQLDVDVSALPAAVYLYRVQVGDNMITKKLIIAE